GQQGGQAEDLGVAGRQSARAARLRRRGGPGPPGRAGPLSGEGRGAPRRDVVRHRGEEEPMTHERLISADSHVNPPKELWTRNAPAKLSDRAPPVESTPQGDLWIVDSQISGAIRSEERRVGKGGAWEG